MRNIVLIGMPTCGKTTFGNLLSRKTGLPLVEMDDEIVRITGMTIPEIFAAKGEEYFRRVETQVAESLRDIESHVISCGGGVVKNERNITCLKKNGLLIWLDRAPELLFPSADRPLAGDPAKIVALYRERYSLYERYADIRVEDNGTIEECLEKLLEIVKETAGEDCGGAA